MALTFSVRSNAIKEKSPRARRRLSDAFGFLGGLTDETETSRRVVGAEDRYPSKSSRRWGLCSTFSIWLILPSPGHTSVSRQGAPTRSQTPLLKSLFRAVFSHFCSSMSHTVCSQSQSIRKGEEALAGPGAGWDDQQLWTARPERELSSGNWTCRSPRSTVSPLD